MNQDWNLESEPADSVFAVETVRRIRAGEPSAEAALVERYSRGVLYLMRRQSGDPELADDLHQETFRVVLERLRGEGLGKPETLAGFIRATALNLLIAEDRKRARRRTDAASEVIGRTGDSQRTGDSGRSQLGPMVRSRQKAAIRQILGELRADRERQMLIRFYLAEEDKEEICAGLGLTSHQFNLVLFRARQRFKVILDRERRGRGVAATLAVLMAAMI